MRTRELKEKVRQILAGRDFRHGLEAIRRYPARRVINPLFSFLISGEELVKWRAVIAMGAVVAGLAYEDMESARVVVRRLMWNLNDESGGIGWGSPEAMGEILARHKGLAEEYACILVAYVRPDGCFIEHELLQEGVLWGLGRLAGVRPRLVSDAAGFLVPFLNSPVPALRGLALRVAGALADPALEHAIERLVDDTGTVKIFLEDRLAAFSVDRLAREALARCRAGRHTGPSGRRPATR